MKGEFTQHEYNGRVLSIYLPENYSKGGAHPVVYALDGDKLFKNLAGIFSAEVSARYIIVGIPSKNRLAEYTPWYLEPINPKFPPFGGKAKEHLLLLTKDLKAWVNSNFHTDPNPEKTFLLGNSLGGLFSVYSLYNSTAFGNIISISGSFWYPGWLQHMETTTIINSAAKVFIISGKTEGALANDPRVNAVTNTRKTISMLQNHLGDSRIFAMWDNGGHHDNINIRYQKAFYWISKNI